MSRNRLSSAFAVFAVVTAAGLSSPVMATVPVAQAPLYLETAVPPLNMLVMGKDHKIYYEAYNDASDLNGDGSLDVGYRGYELKPTAPPAGSGLSAYKIDYFGYFNSYVCYSHDGTKFNPISPTANKQCSGAWSGDFLNYLTTSRIDALRKVLYGGTRNVDTATETVLQGAYIPQDAHSWGKEYRSVARDGYNIANYAPLALPADQSYHLFAVTTVSANTAPLLRVLQNSPYRVWNWLSIEGPVGNLKCFTSGNVRVDCAIAAGEKPFPGHPASFAAFNAMQAEFAVPANFYGSSTTSTATTLNCSSNACNPHGVDDNYLTLIRSQFATGSSRGGYYRFRISGDDNVDFALRNAADSADLLTLGCYPAAGQALSAAGCAESPAGNGILLAASTAYRFLFRHETGTGNDGYRLDVQYRAGTTGAWSAWAPVVARTAVATNYGIQNSTLETYDLTPATAASTRTDYTVRVTACPANAALREATCKEYPNGGTPTFKPTGILHDFGETQKMYFGLITGSQRNNLEGGVLRRNMRDFATEVNPLTGQFRAGVDGIVKSIDRLRMIGGGYNDATANNLTLDKNWNWNNGTGNCGSFGDRAMVNGECRMWGNPIAEMMYEAMRYFAGAEAPSPRFSGTGSSQGRAEETTMGLTEETWLDPYKTVANGGLGYLECAKPVQTVISDINPSYDGDLPGSGFTGASTSVGTTPATISSFNAATQGSTVWSAQFGGGRDVFIGDVGNSTDGAPTVKSASSFGNIRGLSPEEPTKGGTYFAASVAHFAKTNDLNAAPDPQTMSTYSVALASPLPRITIPTNAGAITMVPFAKTVSGTFGDAARKPTNTIVDFYVQQIANFPCPSCDPVPLPDLTINGGFPKATFRINYEDVEQGNDHDMDAIVRYEVTGKADGSVDVQLFSEYAAGSANQYMGYTISGTGQDGVYLEVCDLRTGTSNPTNSTDKALCEASATKYAFNTPPGRAPGYCSAGAGAPADCAGLPPVSSIRNFAPAGSGGGGITLNDPLWYAAKFGGFADSITAPNGLPDSGEWDAKKPGSPDNYFLVTNALTLRAQLEEAFNKIRDESQPAGGIAASGTRRDASFLAYVPEYDTKDWTGDLKAYTLTNTGALGDLVWSAEEVLPDPADRNIFVSVPNGTELELETFSADNLGANDAAAISALGFAPNALSTTYGGATVDEVVDFLRGDQSNEVTEAGGVFRERARRIGDILNSQPAVLDRGSRGYASLDAADGGGIAGSGSYGDFVKTTKQNRTPVVFVGSNDGMLHAFDGSTGASGGEELFAIIPNSVLNRLNLLVDPSYTHRYFVDASPELGDARLGGGWKTILLAGNGAGGRSIMALDVTDTATSFGPDNMLWEFADTDLGMTFGRPQIVLLEDGNWYAAFGNGINSDSHDAYLYLVQLDNVNNVIKIRATEGDDDDVDGLGHNGLGSVTPVDTDFDLRADTIYAPDFQGNIWKFDLTGSSPGSWELGYGGLPLFTASSVDGDPQIVTGTLDVTLHHLNGYMVYFGTGRYLLQGDASVPADPPVETFYAIWDNESTVVSGRGSLEQQTINSESNIVGIGDIRVTSENPIDWTTRRGWFMDLKVAANDGTGERFIGEPTVQLGRVIFTTFQPLGTQCDPGGRNWLYSLSAISGANDISMQPTCADCGGISLTPGGQSSPPAISPPLIADPRNDDPSVPTCTPGDPDCVEPEPGCVPGVDAGCDLPSDGAAIQGRECKVNLGVLLAEGLRNFSEVSCGRQSWRQVQ